MSAAAVQEVVNDGESDGLGNDWGDDNVAAFHAWHWRRGGDGVAQQGGKGEDGQIHDWGCWTNSCVEARSVGPDCSFVCL